MWCNPQIVFPEDLLSVFADFANIIIAFINVALVYYIFVYTQKQDKKQIQLDWFRELVVYPKIDFYNSQFNEILDLVDKLSKGLLRPEEAIAQMKICFANIRIQFIDGLRIADPALSEKAQFELDQLLDNLTELIFEGGLDFSNNLSHDFAIRNPILYTRIDILKLIYAHK